MVLIFCRNDRIITTEISGLKTLTGIYLHGGNGNGDIYTVSQLQTTTNIDVIDLYKETLSFN